MFFITFSIFSELFSCEYPSALYSELPDIGAHTVGRIKYVSVHLSCFPGHRLLSAHFVTPLK